NFNFSFFFFQAEDGIRDRNVTGVQTCALPIYLFFNTPARLKYMKTIHTELGHITDLLNRLAMSHPDIRFEATHNGKSLFRTPGTDDLLQVIAQIYGMKVAKKMLPIQAETLDYSINGYVAKPEITRAS